MTLSQTEKKYALVTGIVLVGILAYQFVIEPQVQEYESAKQALTDTTGKIDRANTLFLTEKRKQISWSTMLAQGLRSRIEEAQSQAQGAVLQWAGGAGVNVSDFHGEGAARQEGKFYVSTFKFTGIGNMRSISRWLHAIEIGAVPKGGANQTPGRIPLRIDDLTITPRKPGTDDLQAVVTVSTLCLISDSTPGNTPNNTNTGPVASIWGDR